MTKNKIQKIALGTVQFGLDYGISNFNGKTDEIEVRSILDLAAQNNVSILDTAQAYGNSEEILGKLHENRFDIITKINPEEDQLNVSILVQESLERLQTSTLYAVLFHSAFSAFKSPKAYSELRNLRNDGILHKVGYSVYTPNELTRLIDKFGLPDLIQIPYNHLDRRFESIACDLHSKGVEIHSRSTFLQGLFFMNTTRLKAFFNPALDYLKILEYNFPDNSERASFLLNFVLSRPFIDKAVIGVNNYHQLSMNIEGVSRVQGEFEIEAPLVSEEILLPYLWK